MQQRPTSTPTTQREAATFALGSAAFRDGETIPKRHTADGENLSPPLTWGEPPPGTRSLALVCDDPDAPRGVFTHWLVWDIDPARRRLAEGTPGDGAAPGIAQGENGFGAIGWGGPSPPPGAPHRYRFTLYALDTPLGLTRGTSRDVMLRAMDGHVLAQAQLIGSYGR